MRVHVHCAPWASIHRLMNAATRSSFPPSLPRPSAFPSPRFPAEFFASLASPLPS